MTRKTLLVAIALCASSAAAEETPDLIPGEFTANIALASEYTFRGISQTDESPAIQGGIDWSLAAGPVSLYLGTWASNVDFDVDETLELDGYGGVTSKLGPVDWDLGIIYYAYPGAELDYDYVEGKLALTYAPHEMITLGARYHYSPDFFAESGDGHYLIGTVSIAPGLPLNITFLGGLGHQWIEHNAVFGAPDYMDWSIGVSAEIEGFTLSATYVDTDLDDDECFGGLDWCDARGLVAISRKF